MLLRLCQLKRPLLMGLFLLASCSTKNTPTPPNEILTTFPNKWFSKNIEHSIINVNEVPVPHLFFDTTADFNSSEKTVNLIITTPEDSPHDYRIDLNSGQRYFTHAFCQQKDVWNNYSKSIFKPVFSIGYMPRTLDQTGEPQKVIVWGKDHEHRTLSATNYHRVRLFGAYIEQVCLDGNCLGKNNWVSRLVFMAVDDDDDKTRDIQTIAEFKEQFDWDKSKAYLGNINGRNFIGDKTYPAFRISEPVEYAEAMEFFKNHSIIFTDEELKKVQTGCHNLYESLWDKVGKIRTEDQEAKTADQMKEKIKLKTDFKKKNLPFGFAARLKVFTKKYFNEITTCEKFVYHGNINQNQEKFWFLSYVGMFYRLHREGYYFDCKTKVWQRNNMGDNGELVHQLKRDINECDEVALDQAMGNLPNFMNGLKGEDEYFRLIDYDTHSFGSHNKLYSWVKMPARRFECSLDPNVEIRRNLKVFPEDVAWKQRAVKDYDDDQKIIR